MEQLALKHQDSAKERLENLKSWALVELFGHQRIVGLVTVEPVEFPGMVRVDVPDLLKGEQIARPGFTRYFGKAAIYGVTPITEQAVRELLPHVDGHPARPLSFGYRQTDAEDDDAY